MSLVSVAGQRSRMSPLRLTVDVTSPYEEENRFGRAIRSDRAGCFEVDAWLEDRRTRESALGHASELTGLGEKQWCSLIVSLLDD